MKAFQANVFIHADEALETGPLAALQGALGKIEGVSDVQPSRCSHLLRVAYDPLATRTQAIVRQVRMQGLHAQRIGEALLPCNRTEPFSLDLLRRTVMSPLVKGNNLQGLTPA